MWAGTACGWHHLRLAPAWLAPAQPCAVRDLHMLGSLASQQRYKLLITYFRSDRVTLSAARKGQMEVVRAALDFLPRTALVAAGRNYR